MSGATFYHRRRPRWMLRMWLWTMAALAGITALAGATWYATDLLIEYESARLGYAIVAVATVVAYGRVNAWMIWPTAWGRGFDEGVYEGCQKGIAAYRQCSGDGPPTTTGYASTTAEDTTPTVGWWP